MLEAAKVNLEESILIDAVFENANLEISKISNTSALNSNFSGANLDFASLSGSNIVRISFENASFQNA